MTSEQRAIIATAIGTLRTASAFLADKDRDCAASEMMVVARQLEELIEKDALPAKLPPRHEPGHDRAADPGCPVGDSPPVEPIERGDHMK